jgi:hypothetical protein
MEDGEGWARSSSSSAELLPELPSLEHPTPHTTPPLELHSGRDRGNHLVISSSTATIDNSPNLTSVTAGAVSPVVSAGPAQGVASVTARVVAVDVGAGAAADGAGSGADLTSTVTLASVLAGLPPLRGVSSHRIDDRPVRLMFEGRCLGDRSDVFHYFLIAVAGGFLTLPMFSSCLQLSHRAVCGLHLGMCVSSFFSGSVSLVGVYLLFSIFKTGLIGPRWLAVTFALFSLAYTCFSAVMYRQKRHYCELVDAIERDPYSRAAAIADGLAIEERYD